VRGKYQWGDLKTAQHIHQFFICPEFSVKLQRTEGYPNFQGTKNTNFKMMSYQEIH